MCALLFTAVTVSRARRVRAYTQTEVPARAAAAATHRLLVRKVIHLTPWTSWIRLNVASTPHSLGVHVVTTDAPKLKADRCFMLLITPSPAAECGRLIITWMLMQHQRLHPRSPTPKPVAIPWSRQCLSAGGSTHTPTSRGSLFCFW